MGFEATCTSCFSTVPLTEIQAAHRVDPDGDFRCDECLRPKPRGRARRDRRGVPETDRRRGCIVTARMPEGDLRAFTQAGKALEALEDIVGRLPPGSTVESVSTHRTILVDMKERARRAGGTALRDPFVVERTMLGKIGRLDLLPDRARR